MRQHNADRSTFESIEGQSFHQLEVLFLLKLLYGYISIIISLLAAVIFSVLLWSNGLHAIPPLSTPLSGRHYLFGGLRACAQMLVVAANMSIIKVTSANTLDLLNNASGNYLFTAKNAKQLTAT